MTPLFCSFKIAKPKPVLDSMKLGLGQNLEMGSQDNPFSGNEVTLRSIDEQIEVETKEVEQINFFGVDFISSQMLFRQTFSDFIELC